MAGGFISSKERETLTLLSKDTEYASDLQTYGWKFAQKFPPKQPFRRKANRNRSTILPKTVLIPRSPPPNAIRRGFRESAACRRSGSRGRCTGNTRSPTHPRPAEHDDRHGCRASSTYRSGASPRRYFSPTIRSSSENVASQAAAVRRSYPAVNA